MFLISYLPLITTFVAVLFSRSVFKRYQEKKGLHLLWWSLGILCFGVGTFIESIVTLYGWNPILFRLWYISGALLGAAPLAQGTVYLLLNKRTAHWLTFFLVFTILSAATCVFLTPLETNLVLDNKLSGKMISWSWVRLFSVFLNIYAVLFLGGGALFSAFKFYRQGKEHSHRFIGNALIFLGTICAATGGVYARLGQTEVLYVAELVALVVIYLGYIFASRSKV